mmetsp:Transcript_34094/g.81596  ORF Transcript_34094/g.81596 Transcript_34094/m.81596 type:complete len:296 (+) Transcript_34094:219-1106(+)
MPAAKLLSDRRAECVSAVEKLKSAAYRLASLNVECNDLVGRNVDLSCGTAALSEKIAELEAEIQCIDVEVNSWKKLTDIGGDILLSVLAFVDPRDLDATSLVCRRLRRLANSGAEARIGSRASDGDMADVPRYHRESPVSHLRALDSHYSGPYHFEDLTGLKYPPRTDAVPDLRRSIYILSGRGVAFGHEWMVSGTHYAEIITSKSGDAGYVRVGVSSAIMFEGYTLTNASGGIVVGLLLDCQKKSFIVYADGQPHSRHALPFFTKHFRWKVQSVDTAAQFTIKRKRPPFGIKWR